MASRKNFQSKTAKHGTNSRTSNDAELTSQVDSLGEKNQSFIEKNLDKLVEMISYFRFYPDLFLDLCTPSEGGIKLHTDQRVYYRIICRFYSVYGVFPRGWGKTHGEVLISMIICILFPGETVALTAQTKENAASLLGDKFKEIMKQYPILENEISKKSFSKDVAEIVFANGSILNTLANSQTSKGQRRNRIQIEEAALLNNELFEDALKPIVEVPRYTVGKLSIVDPEELNQQVNFFTTSGWRGSTEFMRNIDMIDNMANCNGDYVVGADWHLACWYGRGSTKSQVMNKKRTMSQIAFDQNYGSKWTGNANDALVDINKLLSTRTLLKPELKAEKGAQYAIAVDVARSEGKSNNRSSIIVLKLSRTGNRFTSMDLVNLTNVSNAMNFTGQSIEVKRKWRDFNIYGGVSVVVIDINGLGRGLLDEIAKEHRDPITNEIYPCFDTFNTEDLPETSNSIKIVHGLTSQSAQTEIITCFINAVESGNLRLLEKKTNAESVEYEDDKDLLVQHMHTDMLVEEISNLKLKELPSKKLTVERVVRRIDKDRWAALVYGIWYCKTFLEREQELIEEFNFDNFISNVSGSAHKTPFGTSTSNPFQSRTSLFR